MIVFFTCIGYNVFNNKSLLTIETSVWYAYIIFGLSALVFVSSLEELIKIIKIRREHSGESILLASCLAILQNKRRYVGYLVHISLAIMFIGFAGKAFNHETKLALKQGEAEEFQGYLIKLDKIEDLQYSNGENKAPLYVSKKATISVYKNNVLLGRDSTEIRNYPMYNLRTQEYDDQQPTSEPCIIADGIDDVYLQLGGSSEDTHSLIFQVWINPLVRMVWIGFAFFIFSGLLLLLPFGEGKEIRIGTKVIPNTNKVRLLILFIILLFCRRFLNPHSGILFFYKISS